MNGELNPDEVLRDYEVRRTNPDNTSEVITIGYSPSEAEACERACSRSPAGTTAVVVRVLQEHSPRSTQIATLTEHWEPVVSDSVTGRRFVLRDPQGRMAASEYEGGHMLTAWRFLTRERPEAAWKTADLLTSLRQAIREEHAACRSEYLDDLFSGRPTRDRVRGFLQGARVRDLAHHGCHTF